MDDEFVTSAIVALSSFNYYFDGTCRNFLVQALKSSCTVKTGVGIMLTPFIFLGPSFIQYKSSSDPSSL